MPLGMLVKGEWIDQREQEDSTGRFVRRTTRFRDRVSADGSSGFRAGAGRYHLYVSWACPWAHRTAIMRKLKGLEEAISLSVVDPLLGDEGWAFSENPGAIPDAVNGASHLKDVYTLADPGYTGLVTVPVLWDKEEGTVVSNESREIIRMFDTEFEEFATTGADFYPEDLREEVDATIEAIYDPINNGVYRAGFATTQEAYEEAVTELFDALGRWDEALGERRYLCGDRTTEADWCMFTTLLRFELVYHYHFKCNLWRLRDYPNLWGYLKDLYQQPGVSETVFVDHIKRGYYLSYVGGANPSGIVPKGPVIDFDGPHERGRIAGSVATSR